MSRLIDDMRDNKIALLTVCAGPAYWAIDAAAQAYVFGAGGFLRQLFAPGPTEMWVRLFIVTITTLFGFVFLEHGRKELALGEAMQKYRQQFESGSAGDGPVREYLQKKEAAIKEQEASISAREEALKDALSSLRECQEQVVLAERALQQKEAALKAAALSRQEPPPTEAMAPGKSLQEEKERLKAAEESLREKGEQLKVIAASLIKKEESLKSGEEISRRRESYLNEKEKALGDKEAQLKSLSATLYQKEEQLREKEEEPAQPQPQRLERAAGELQLLQASKMAAIGQFATGVAIEINSPLAAILNNVQQCRQEMQQKADITQEGVKSLLGVVEESALRCKNIVQSLSGFSRIQQETFQPVSLNEIINRMAALVENRLRLQNVTVKKQFQLNLPKVSGDAQLLQLALFNLIFWGKWSIQKKSSRDGGSIVITTLCKPEDTSVYLYMQDTGAGLTRESLEHIFEPFFAPQTAQEEIGLELSFVRNIINDHRGSISVESKEGEGTTFIISLPSLDENDEKRQ